MSITLLGPQRFNPILREVLEPHRFDKPYALITAGWQEREEEVQELDEHVQHQTVQLFLHERSDRLFAEYPQFRIEYRRRQSCLRRMQDLYRIQLEGLLEKARLLQVREEEAELLQPALHRSFHLIQSLDEMHLQAIRQIHHEFDQAWPINRLAKLQKEREELAARLENCSAALIAGGHVIVLLNRIRLFGLDLHLARLPLFAWSAGAMVLCQRVVLFHDFPPQGQGNPEVVEQGLGLLPGVVALPHAAKRLKLHDEKRVALFANRFAPDCCLALDPNTCASWQGSDLRALRAISRLSTQGHMVELQP
jgi:hypothetical protein